MATDPLRRHLLLRTAALALSGLAARDTAWAGVRPLTREEAPELIANWQVGGQAWTGRLRAGPSGHLQVVQALKLPTRAHGCVQAPGRREVLTVARRPGDWLLKWSLDNARSQRHWIEDDHVFNGHAVFSPDGRRVFTTETRLDTGDGVVGVRDAHSLQRLASWSTAGWDPHELVWAPEGVFERPTLMVANGGIPYQPETGRAKVGLDRMAPSLVALDATTGQVCGQWRLPDPRLSVRHLAWHQAAGQPPVLGVALQAEHDDPSQRAAAPVLALWRRDTGLQTPPAQPDLAGYGGAITGTDTGFAIGAPRAHRVARWTAQGDALEPLALPDACPVAGRTGRGLWAGGRASAWQLVGRTPQPWSIATPDGLLLDNHWALVMPRNGPP